MIKQIADLHIHSKYARACSPLLDLQNIAKTCEIKGINICATGDFTHPIWFKHIQTELKEIKNTGLYKLKNDQSETKFILTTEVSCVYRHKDKVRRLHLILIAPSIDAVSKFNLELAKRDVNLHSDGRPIMGLSAKEVLAIILEIDVRFVMIPAHAWTPWFAIFGSKSGYDSLEECFEELTPHIFAIETGLSSDPLMNRRLKQLDNIVLVSNSDAHSLDNLGREANVFVFKKQSDITFNNLIESIKSNDKSRFLYTIEFYPEEGMYFADGHRLCGINMSPKASKNIKNICPKCKKELTIGVLHRVDDLADRSEKNILKENYIPFKYIIPLREIISEVFGVGVKSKKVKIEYQNMISKIGNEFFILLEASLDIIKKNISNQDILYAIKNMRSGKVEKTAGFDGQYGKIRSINRK